MPGSIQSIERAAAIIRLLAASPHRLRLVEIAAALQLPKATVHGILSTLVAVEFVEQDRATGRYHLGRGLYPDSAHVDVNDLRARSFNWADPLAARTGAAVRIATMADDAVTIAHHVLSPDRRQPGNALLATVPAHATALGKVLLAFNPAAVYALPERLTAYTARTITDHSRLLGELERVRAQRYAVEVGEHEPELAAVAAPVHGVGGLVVAAVAAHGTFELVCTGDGHPRQALVERVVCCARSISGELASHRMVVGTRGGPGREPS